MIAPDQPRPIFPTLPVELGDYTLAQLLGSHLSGDCYMARQLHVERRVALEVLRPLEEGGNMQAEEFRAMARARVAANLPHVAPVLESATSPEGFHYICQELPEGTPLSVLIARGELLSVIQACALVAAAGELYGACARDGRAAAPLMADRVFMNPEDGSFRFLSPVLQGSPREGETCMQQQALAAIIRPMQPTNVSGQTRLHHLLSWMQEGYMGEQLSWPDLTDTANLVIEQLKPQPSLRVKRPQRYDSGRDKRAGKRRRKQKLRVTLLIGAALAVICGMGITGYLLAPDSTEPIPALRGGYVHARCEGEIVRVAAQPVSISEYCQFLDAYPTLDPTRRGSLTRDIPPTESDPTPADWEAMRTAAEQGAQWQGRWLSMSAPVTNVSYWQVLMYTRYKRAKLPGVALLSETRAKAGLPGVEEWTQDESPAAQPYTKARLVLPAGAGSSPLPENNPAARNPQRGFRICP